MKGLISKYADQRLHYYKSLLWLAYDDLERPEGRLGERNLCEALQSSLQIVRLEVLDCQEAAKKSLHVPEGTPREGPTPR